MTPSGRALVRGILDVCVAGVVAVVFWLNVGVAGGSDTNPPTCTTSTGRSVDCFLEGPLRLAQAAVFLAVLTALVTWQVVGSRRRARDEAAKTRQGMPMAPPGL